MASGKTQDAPSTDLVERVYSSTDLAQLVDLERILTAPADDMSVQVPDVSDDPEAISREIIAQLLAATSDDELENRKALSWRDELAGVPLELRSFHWRPSGFKDKDGTPQGQRVFFVVQAVRLDTGEFVTTTTGSANVLAAIVNLAKRGRIPGAIRQLEKLPETSNGFTPLALTTPAQYREQDRANEQAARQGETA